MKTRRLMSIVLTTLVIGASFGAGESRIGQVTAHAAVQPPARQDEFVPVSELPAQEQLPAAPLLVVAYAVVWVVLLWYVWSVWRRLRKLEREIADVAARSLERRQ